MRAIVDTGAIYALVVKSDANHPRARAFMESWLARSGSFVLLDVVFVETMTLLKARLGATTAIRVGRELRENPLYDWVALGAEGERDAWGVFQRYDDKGWSFTDCALLAAARRLGVTDVFSFDRHVEQMPGLVRLPRKTEKRR